MTDYEKRLLADGRAVLYRGDSLELLRAGLLPKWDALVSDPPYGIGFVLGNGGKRNFSNTHHDPIIGDDRPFDPRPWTEATGDRPTVLFGADHYKTRLPEGGRFICWDKSCGQGVAACFVDAEFAWTNRRNPRCIVRHFWMESSAPVTSSSSGSTGKSPAPATAAQGVRIFGRLRLQG